METDKAPLTLKVYVRQFCKKHGITVKELAAHAGMPRSTLYGMMDNAQPTVKNLCKLAVAMQVHPAFLFNLEWQKCKLDGIHATPVECLPKAETYVDGLLDNAHFVSETIPDGSLMGLAEKFTKTWRLQNTGETVWKGRRLVCQNDYQTIQQEQVIQAFSPTRSFHITPLQEAIDVPTTLPGEMVELSVDFITPSVPATAFSYWKMTNADGKLCFPDSIGLFVQIQSVSAGSAFALSHLDVHE